MSILDLQLSDGVAPCGVGALMREGTGSHDLRLSFTTASGSDVIESFEVRVSAKGYAKGSPYESAWRDYEATVPASKCGESRPVEGGRASWSVPLSLVGALATQFGPWSYASRTHDTATFDVSVRARWSSDVMGVGGSKADWASEWASAELYMGFLADYSITSAHYESGELLVIEYSTTWTRQDDRFALSEESAVVEGGSESPLVGREAWGTVAAPGRIEVPVESLSQHAVGKLCRLKAAFNPSYRPIIVGRATAEAELVVGDGVECDSCTLELADAGDPYAVAVRTGDAGDVGVACSKVTVKCRTQTGYSSTETVACGDVAVMRGCPLNTPLTFEGVGSSGTATSRTVTVLEAPAIASRGVAVVESADPDGGRVVVKYNQKFGVSSEPDADSVKLAGRARPSSFYGRGGSKTVKLDGVLLDDDATVLEEMPMHGDAFVRFPDGRSYRCRLGVSIDWDYSRLRNVSITGEEVA